MWIFLTDAFLSIVEAEGDRSKLLVRARCRGDLEKTFPAADVSHTPVRADYPYRAFIDRAEVAAKLAAEVGRIDYHNFKSAVREDDRHDAYMGVWSTMRAFQREREGPRPPFAGCGELFDEPRFDHHAGCLCDTCEMKRRLRLPGETRREHKLRMSALDTPLPDEVPAASINLDAPLSRAERKRAIAAVRKHTKPRSKKKNMLNHEVRHLQTNRVFRVTGIGLTTAKLGAKRVPLNGADGYCHDLNCPCGALRKRSRYDGPSRKRQRGVK